MKRINKIWGIGLIVVLVVTMFGFAIPASAGTLSWSDETIPDDTGKVIVATTDIGDIAVSDDGMTVYVADTQGEALYKSADGGKTWSEIDFGTSITITTLEKVAVAPDDADVVAVIANTKEVYVSTNGGSAWKTALSTVAEGAAANATALYDIDVSVAKSGANYIGVAGLESGGAGNVWYYDLGVGGFWHETNDRTGFGTSSTVGFASVDSAVAVAFSPNFNSDSVMTAVTYSDNSTGSTANVTFQIFSTSTSIWNNAAGFGSGYPVTIATGATAAVLSGVTVASIALSPTYLGSDDSERISFVGLALTGTSGTTLSGVVRLKDTSKKLLNDGILTNSVAYDGTNLVVGRYDNNYTYFTDEPLVTTPSFTTSRSLKRVQGETQVVVAWADGEVMAGAIGNESAFCVSTDNGLTFNGLSLVDSALGNIEDVATSSDGSMVYMATDDTGTDLSIWRKDSSGWVRVLSELGSVGSGYILRTSPANPDIIYAAKKGSQTIYYSQDAGTTKWFTRTAKYSLQDLAVESDDAAYIAVDGQKTISKTTNGGFTWSSSTDTLLSGGDIHSIASVSVGNVLVGSTSGYISYSTDGGSSWTRVQKVFESGAGNMQIAASGLASGDFVYAATSENGTGVRRWEVGGSSWTSLEASTGTMGATGIQLFNGVLYVAITDGNDSNVIRDLAPTASVPVSTDWSTTASAGETFTTDPSALKATVSGSNVKLWAIDAAVGTDALFSYTDILAAAGPTLTSPADKKLIPVNPITGYANDISLVWEQPPKGRAYTYDVKVALDSGFKETIISTTKNSSASSPSTLIDGSSLNPGTTYYWRIRVANTGDGPILSPYSQVRSFTLEPGAALTPAILAPANGASNASLVPAFSWDPVSGATQYEFALSVAPHAAGWKTPVYTSKIAETSIVPPVKLDYNMTYFWRVRAIAPVMGSWSAIANFTTMAEPTEPTPPVVVQEVPAPIINIPPAPAPQQIVIPPPPPPPAQIAPAYIWAIIVIGAVLVIAVIVLIVRTRRAV